MLKDSDKIKVLCGIRNIDKIRECRPLEPFNRDMCEFITSVSNELMNAEEAKAYTDVVAFAFFCRSANLNKVYDRLHLSNEVRIGRGMIFHIAPGNIAVNFAYSLVAALLSGNSSIVKISNKDFPQTKIIIHAFQKILNQDRFQWIIPYINVWVYQNQYESITEYISSLCKIRVIWGGDNTIDYIRKMPLSPRAFDVTFADRCSLCIIHAKKLLETSDLNTVARNFYNDTYLMDQNACTAPFLIIWSGSEEMIDNAKKAFWSAVSNYVKSNYELKASIAVDKLDMAYQAAIRFSGDVDIIYNDNLIYRINIKKLEEDLPKFRCAGGFFYEYSAMEHLPLISFITERYQTLSYFGYGKEELKRWVMSNGLGGIDRVVSLGRTMDFDLVWDGYDLTRIFSRQISGI